MLAEEVSALLNIFSLTTILKGLQSCISVALCSVLIRWQKGILV